MTRLLVLGAALLFIVGFAFLTISAVSQQGFTLLSAVSIFVLVLLGIGIVGALLQSPRDDEHLSVHDPRPESAAARDRPPSAACPQARDCRRGAGAGDRRRAGGDGARQGARLPRLGLGLDPSSRAARVHTTTTKLAPTRSPIGLPLGKPPLTLTGIGDPRQDRRARRLPQLRPAPGCCSTSTRARCCGSATPTRACGSPA